MPIDHFNSTAPSLSSPATGIEEMIPSDSTDVAVTTRALNVGQSGTVRVATSDGTIADLFIAAGIAFPVRVTRVYATGTDAGTIRGLY